MEIGDRIEGKQEIELRVVEFGVVGCGAHVPRHDQDGPDMSQVRLRLTGLGQDTDMQLRADRSCDHACMGVERERAGHGGVERSDEDRAYRGVAGERHERRKRAARARK